MEKFKSILFNGVLIVIFIVFLYCVGSSFYLSLEYDRDNAQLPENNEWNGIKNKCEFGKSLDSGDVEFACNNIIVTINSRYKREIDNLNWNSFKRKNHCRLVKIDFTSRKSLNEWLCDENITIYNNIN